jgi:P4 family phage/plasmid primase-like protien
MTMTLVERARQYLGDKALLVPCTRGTKVPMQPYKHRPDDQFMTEAWLALFDVEQANVAVILGRRSDHLVAIDFDDEGFGLAFDAANPDLVGTLRTTGSRGWQIWLRIPDGSYPASTKTPECEWRADGNLSTFAGVHPSGVDYRILEDAPPLETSFDRINWPAGWVVPSGNKAAEEALAAIEQAHGPAFFQSDKGVPQGMNEPFWAGLYCFEHTILWSPGDERFYSYQPSNGLWQTEPVPSIRSKLSNRMLEASRVMNVPWIAKQRSASKLAGILSHVQAQACRRQPWRKELNFLHVANGVLVWRGDEFIFEEFSPDFYSRNASPVAYVPGARCPRFQQELLGPALRPEDQILLQKFAGLYLMGRNPLQRFLILEGAAGTGKSQIAVILRGLVGDHNCANLRTELLDERFELANYRGKSLLIGSDVGSDFLSNRGAQTLKALTGGDQLMVELKGCNEPEVLIGDFNVLVTTNCRLRVRLQEDNEAWRRRIAVISFSGQPPEKAIRDFGALLLQSEGPGLLNWAMDGLKMLFKELDENNGRLRLDQAQIDRVDRLILESQSLKGFLKEEVRWDVEADLSTSEILEAYADWCERKQIEPIPEFVAQKQLPHLMLELFKVSKSNDIDRNGKNLRGFARVAFKNPTDGTDGSSQVADATDPY